MLAAPSGFSSLGLLEGASLPAGRPVSVRPPGTNGTYPTPRMISMTIHCCCSNPSCDRRSRNSDHLLRRMIPSCDLRRLHTSRQRGLSYARHLRHRNRRRGLSYALRLRRNQNQSYTGHNLHRTIPNCGLQNRAGANPGHAAAARKEHAARYESPAALSAFRGCSWASHCAAPNRSTAACCFPGACCFPAACCPPAACCLPNPGASALR